MGKKLGIKQFHLCPRGTKIVVGVSGGADSVALLHLLRSFREEMQWQLLAVHVHHGLRGAEADEDCAFVTDLCGKWNVECKVYSFDVKAEAQQRGLGEEETGRLLRYQAFREEAAGGLIAVAHHKNDQAETMLMRLCRGTGLTGLCAMEPKRGDLIRPLLCCTRGEIEEYCRENGLAFRQDSTNEEDGYTRNRIRNRVFPILEAMYPKATEHMAKTAELLAEEEHYLEEEAERCFKEAVLEKEKDALILCRKTMAEQHPAMKKRVLRKTLALLGLQRDFTATHVEDLLSLLEKPTGKSLSLPYGIRAENCYEKLILRTQQEKTPPFCYELSLGEAIVIPEAELEITIHLFSQPNEKMDEEGYTNVFDYDKIKNGIFCRNRKAGDAIALGSGTKKLKAYFIDQKIPRDQRDKQPLLADGEEVIWVIGKQISANYLPHGDTKRFLRVRIRRMIEE